MNPRSVSPFNLPARPLLMILSGTSGAGKDAILNRMKELNCSFAHITTVTTRPRRDNEKDNVDYQFTSTEKFHEMIKHDELLEWAKVYGNFYGVPRQPVKQALDNGQDVIIKVDVQGAATIKKAAPQAIFIFLMPPSIEDLILRLKQRRTESVPDLELRIKTAEAEMKLLQLFDYVVVNRHNEIDRAATDIMAIITAEKCRVTTREITL